MEANQGAKGGQQEGMGQGRGRSQEISSRSTSVSLMTFASSRWFSKIVCIDFFMAVLRSIAVGRVCSPVAAHRLGHYCGVSLVGGAQTLTCGLQ